MRTVDRRTVLAMGGIAGASALSGCGPFGAFVANPATSSFVQQLGIAIAATGTVDVAAMLAEEPASALATRIREVIPEWLGETAWSRWPEGYRTEEGDVVLVGFVPLTSEEWKSSGQYWRDAEVAVMLDKNGVIEGVRLPSWAWQGLVMFNDWYVGERPSEQQAEARALANYALRPGSTRSDSGESPTGLVAWAGYQNVTGSHIDIAKLEREDHTYSVWIKISGLPDSTGAPLIKEFELPTAESDSQPQRRIWT